jgi:hypothetical protein
MTPRIVRFDSEQICQLCSEYLHHPRDLGKKLTVKRAYLYVLRTALETEDRGRSN